MESARRMTYGITWSLQHPIAALETSSEAVEDLQATGHEQVELLYTALKEREKKVDQAVRGFFQPHTPFVQFAALLPYRLVFIGVTLTWRLALRVLPHTVVGVSGWAARICLRGSSYTLQLAQSVLGRTYNVVIRYPLNATLLRPFTWKLSVYVATPENDLFSKLFQRLQRYFKPYSELADRFVNGELSWREYFKALRAVIERQEKEAQEAQRLAPFKALDKKPFDAALCNTYAQFPQTVPSLLGESENYAAIIHFQRRLAKEQDALNALEIAALRPNTVLWLLPHLSLNSSRELYLYLKLLSRMTQEEALKPQVTEAVCRILRIWPNKRYNLNAGGHSATPNDAQDHAIHPLQPRIAQAFAAPLDSNQILKQLNLLMPQVVEHYFQNAKGKEAEEFVWLFALIRHPFYPEESVKPTLARLQAILAAKFPNYPAFIHKYLSVDILQRCWSAQKTISGAIGELFLYLLETTPTALAENSEATKAVFGMLLRQCLRCDCNAPAALKERLIAALQKYKQENYDALFTTPGPNNQALEPTSGYKRWLNTICDAVAVEIIAAVNNPAPQR